MNARRVVVIVLSLAAAAAAVVLVGWAAGAGPFADKESVTLKVMTFNDGYLTVARSQPFTVTG